MEVGYSCSARCLTHPEVPGSSTQLSPMHCLTFGKGIKTVHLFLGKRDGTITVRLKMAFPSTGKFRLKIEEFIDIFHKNTELSLKKSNPEIPSLLSTSLKLIMRGFPVSSTKGAGTAAAGRDRRTPGISSTCCHAAAGFAAPFLCDQKWGISLLGEKMNFLKPADMRSPRFGCAKQAVPKTSKNFKMVWGDEYIQV